MSEYVSDNDNYPAILALKWDMMLGTNTQDKFGEKVWWSKVECKDKNPNSQNENEQLKSTTNDYQNTDNTLINNGGTKVNNGEIEENNGRPEVITNKRELTCPIKRNPRDYNNYGC
uniref:Uncharacterized protein n=1 Tax=Meloidogyne hapla TaxID=6305 RepID=A0A1I8AZE8_MELHA